MPTVHTNSTIHLPEIPSALLNVGAATNYDEFSSAVMTFLRETITFNAAEVRLRILDPRNDNAVHVASNFPAKRTRTAEELALRKRIAPAFDFMERNPATTVYRGQHQTLPAGRELERLQFFKEFMVPEGWHDNLGMAFWGKSGHESWIFVNRAFNQPAFGDAEVRLFQQVYPFFAGALRRIHLLADAQAVRADLESSLLDLPIASLVLDWQLQVEQANHAAHRLCDSWRRGIANARLFKAPDRIEMAPEILAVCRELRDLWREGSDVANRDLRRIVPHPSIPGMQATVTLLRPKALRLSGPSFLVRITEVLHYANKVPAESNRDQVLTRLTPAERDVARLAAQGETNKAIAQKLGKSFLTVKNQVHTILEKVGATNRTQLSTALRE